MKNKIHILHDVVSHKRPHSLEKMNVNFFSEFLNEIKPYIIRLKDRHTFSGNYKEIGDFLEDVNEHISTLDKHTSEISIDETVVEIFERIHEMSGSFKEICLLVDKMKCHFDQHCQKETT